jgi:hypothetical protein
LRFSVAFTQQAASTARLASEERRAYFGPIDIWPDDWAASPHMSGRTFRLPLQKLDEPGRTPRLLSNVHID